MTVHEMSMRNNVQSTNYTIVYKVNPKKKIIAKKIKRR